MRVDTIPSTWRLLGASFVLLVPGALVVAVLWLVASTARARWVTLHQEGRPVRLPDLVASIRLTDLKEKARAAVWATHP